MAFHSASCSEGRQGLTTGTTSTASISIGAISGIAPELAVAAFVSAAGGDQRLHPSQEGRHTGRRRSGTYSIATGLTGEPVPPTTRSGLMVSMNS